MAGLLLPEAVAYAGIAHLPVAHALVACLAGLVVYASAGASRDAIVAPTSSSASLAAAAALSLPVAGALGYAQTLVALTLAAGVVLLLLAVARQGQLSAFVSRPVLRGFAFALALTIVVRQLPDALGVTPAPEVPPDPLHLLVHLLVRWREWHPISLGLAVIAGGLITLLRRWPQWPASLIVLVLAVWLGWGLNLSAWGVAEVGVVPEPTWTLAWPRFTLDTWLRVSELAVGLVVLLFAESWGAMRSLALVRGDTLNPNRELLALGLANVASGLLNGMPVGAGFSASMANHGAGAKSRKAGLIAFALIALAVAVALPALRFLPRPVLAVAVIGALWHALSPRPLLATWRLGRDRLLIVGAVSAVLVIGLLHGMLAAVALSIVEALRRFSQPLVDELGELAETRNFVALDEHGEARPVPGLLVLRPQEPLFFASAERTMAEVAQRLSAAQAQTLVLSLEDSTDLDSTALECLLELDTRLRRSGRRLVLARAKERVRALLRLAAPQGLGQDACLFWSVADAVEAVRYTAAGDSSAKP